MGRWPNPDSANTGYRIITTGGSTSISDNILNISSRPADLDNSPTQIVLRTNNTNIDIANVTSISSTGTIYFNGKTSNLGAGNGFGYFFRNALSTLDRQYEWFFDNLKDSLFVYSLTQPTTIKVATKDYAIYLNDKQFVTIDGLELSGSNKSAVYINGTGKYNTIKNCSILFAGKDGIEVVPTQRPTSILSCTISKCHNTGINFGYYGDSATVRLCYVLKCGLIPGMGAGNNGNYSGIFAGGDYNTLSRNVVYSIGNNGIMAKSEGVKMDSNWVYNFNNILDDGGGIYIVGPSSTDPLIYYKNKRYIRGNIVYNGIGNVFGTDDYPASQSSSKSSGIYVDNASNNVTITDNTVYNCSKAALYIHQSWNLTINNNKFINMGTNRPASMQDDDAARAIDSIYMKNNLFAQLKESGYGSAFQYISYSRGVSDVPYALVPGDVDYNKYYNMINANIPYMFAFHYTNSSGSGSGVTSDKTLTEWRSTMKCDYNSTVPTNTYADTTGNFLILTNPDNSPKTFSLLSKTWVSMSGITSENNISYTNNTATIAPYKSLFLLRTGSMRSIYNNGTTITEQNTLYNGEYLKAQAYPNPVNNQFHLTFPNTFKGDFNIDIIDLTGRIYKLGKHNISTDGYNVTINISKLSLRAGQYFIKILSEKQGAQVIKFIVQ